MTILSRSLIVFALAGPVGCGTFPALRPAAPAPTFELTDRIPTEAPAVTGAEAPAPEPTPNGFAPFEAPPSVGRLAALPGGLLQAAGSTAGAADFDGVPMQRVTSTQAGACFDPDLSPDGRRLVFASTQHRNTADLYVKATNGVTITRLTDTTADEVMPAFAPDGRRVAFATNRDGNWNLYVTDVDGRAAVQVTDDPEHELHPTWSPDGKRLAYCRLGAQSGAWEIWVLDLDRGLHTFVAHGLLPRWSPTEERIAFQRTRQRGDEQFSIWTIDLIDGEARRPTEIVSADDGTAMHPAWSPNGRQLAFVTVDPEAGATGLWVVNLDGSGRTKLAGGTGTHSPVWGADGTIQFVSSRSGQENIWAVTSTIADDAQELLTAQPTDP